MRDFIIMTDSSCDLPAELADELELAVVPLHVMVKEKAFLNYLDWREIPCRNFFDLLRAGNRGQTSAPNLEQFTSAMEAILQAGKDILYLGFSSALSGTYHAGTVAAEELREKYPEATILTVDTLCASLGQGMLVFLAVKEKRAGKTMEQVRDFVEEQKLHLCHWFTVDDLNYLKLGGRVSAAKAFLGTALNIKPILHVDDEGRLTPVGKTKGRKQSFRKLAEHMKETGINTKDQTIFISHGDCRQEAEEVADILQAECGFRDVVIGPVGPVVGAHAGPGVMAIFFLGTHR